MAQKGKPGQRNKSVTFTKIEQMERTLKQRADRREKIVQQNAEAKIALELRIASGDERLAEHDAKTAKIEEKLALRKQEQAEKAAAKAKEQAAAAIETVTDPETPEHGDAYEGEDAEETAEVEA